MPKIDRNLQEQSFTLLRRLILYPDKSNRTILGNVNQLQSVLHNTVHKRTSIYLGSGRYSYVAIGCGLFQWSRLACARIRRNI